MLQRKRSCPEMNRLKGAKLCGEGPRGGTTGVGWGAHGELGSPEAPGGVEPPSFSGPTRHPLSKGVNHPDHPAPS